MDSRLYSQSLTNSPDAGQESADPSLAQIETLVQTLAQSSQGDCLALLALLRLLERLHRDVRDGLFQQALPSNRQHLYQLLRSIETEGGWPYIHRMKLQTLLDQWLVAEPGEVQSDEAHSNGTVEVEVECD
jgi:hypothetical protein